MFVLMAQLSSGMTKSSDNQPLQLPLSFQTLPSVLYYQIISSNDKYEEIKAKPIKGPEDIQELAKLKSELNLLERQEIARKFSTHEISGNAKLTTYELPIFAKIPVAKHDTGTKTPKSDTKFDTGLQGLFQQKQR